jgi:tripartite-type tricarboxylate transporter receptor subunit TctC
LKVQSLQQLITLARARPGTLNWSSGGGALTYVLAGFLTKANLEMVAIPYREQRGAIQDLASGRLHVMITVRAALLPQANAGTATPLAVTNSKRAPIAPQVPTAIELGYPELAFDGLWGFFGPRDMPNARRDQIRPISGRSPPMQIWRNAWPPSARWLMPELQWSSWPRSKLSAIRLRRS